jgi:VIT1/CCC1 family predicted Fe2+/Mn2+ transporter
VRVCHLVGLVMLFLVGHRLGAFSGQGAWRMGFSMVGLGVVLVALTILLGG